jgi:peptide/nickel transport system permease protein
MSTYIIRRLLLIFPTLFGITIITFLVMALSPGGIRAAIANREGTLDPKQRAAIRKFYEQKYGLDQPLPVQYLRWVNHVSFIGVKDAGAGWPGSWRFGFKPPDLGESISSRRPVLDLIEESLPVTLLLNVIALPLTMGLSIWSGIIAARNRGGFADVAGGTILLGLWSLPQIWVGILLIGFLASKQTLHWFPDFGLHDIRADEMNFLPTFSSPSTPAGGSSFTGGFQRGYLLDTAWHLVLPLVCLVYGGFAFTSKLTRASMLENLASDFVRTARAKGVGEDQILYQHVLRNSLLPLITVSASLLPGLIGGSIIVESIFAIPGMGKLGVDAVFDKDPEMVLSTTLVASVLTLAGYLLADIAYAVADPRVNFEATNA